MNSKLESIHSFQKCYLYRHIRLDIGEPFYIGIGTKGNSLFKTYNQEYKRAFTTKRRNSIWNNIFNKTEIEVEILLDNLTINEAKEWINIS